MLRYAITDRMRLGESELERRAALLALANRWAIQGIDYIQIREKDLSAKALLELSHALAAALATAASPTGTRTTHAEANPNHKRPPKLLINSRPDVAIAVGLDGVHLTASPGALEPRQIHRIYASRSLKPPTISISCHTLDEVRRAADQQVDLILFSPVFGKSVITKSAPNQPTRRQQVTPPASLEALSAACEAAGNIPVLALGGITQANTAACLKAGAKGIAAITLFSS